MRKQPINVDSRLRTFIGKYLHTQPTTWVHSVYIYTDLTMAVDLTTNLLFISFWRYTVFQTCRCCLPFELCYKKIVKPKKKWLVTGNFVFDESAYHIGVTVQISLCNLANSSRYLPVNVFNNKVDILRRFSHPYSSAWALH